MSFVFFTLLYFPELLRKYCIAAAVVGTAVLATEGYLAVSELFCHVIHTRKKVKKEYRFVLAHSVWFPHCGPLLRHDSTAHLTASRREEAVQEGSRTRRIPGDPSSSWAHLLRYLDYIPK